MIKYENANDTNRYESQTIPTDMKRYLNIEKKVATSPLLLRIIKHRPCFRAYGYTFFSGPWPAWILTALGGPWLFLRGMSSLSLCHRVPSGKSLENHLETPVEKAELWLSLSLSLCHRVPSGKTWKTTRKTPVEKADTNWKWRRNYNIHGRKCKRY